VRRCKYQLLFFLFPVLLLSQKTDNSYIYYKNFVTHAGGEYCTHQTPEATFTVYLNDDQSRILTESAPRWQLGGDPNINGQGVFGIELGNFSDPAIAVGDSVFIQFTCNISRQQGLLKSAVLGIPWYYFPATLRLTEVSLPDVPQNVTCRLDSVNNYRLISWDKIEGMTYRIYRRSFADLLESGEARMLYHLIAEVDSEDHVTDTTAGSGFFGYIVYAQNQDGTISSHSEEASDAPVLFFGDDLTVGWIARLPRISYVWNSPEPWVDGWPARGQKVRWQAVIKNWFSDVNSVDYIWYLDGVPVDSGTVTVTGDDTAHVDYAWSWQFERHELKIVIDPHNSIYEEEEQNNSLGVFTDAISVGFWVEKSVYEYFRKYQKELAGVHSNCWEDWAQRHVKRWNEMFKNAVYPDSPNGVLDRIRIDKILVVDDGALPLNGGLPTNNPDLSERTVDLQWGFPAVLINEENGHQNFYADVSSISLSNPFYFEGSLLHELGHARYLVDVYGFNVNPAAIAIQENNQPVLGSDYLPSTYYTPVKGLMNSTYTFIDRYSASALNLIAGHRAVSGNYNAPENIGIFLNDLPAENQLTVKDNNRNILPNAKVWVYQSKGASAEWYGKHFGGEPDLRLIADDSGRILLGRNPFSSDGVIIHTFGKSNVIAILRVEYDSQVAYGYLDLMNFNLEYWCGHTKLASYEMKFNLVPSAMEVDPAANLPVIFEMGQNYPNPFNRATKIPFTILKKAEVTLTIFDLTGKEILSIVPKEYNPGYHTIEFKAAELGSGIYIYRLRSGEHCCVRKMLFVK